MTTGDANQIALVTYQRQPSDMGVCDIECDSIPELIFIQAKAVESLCGYGRLKLKG